MFPTPLPPTTHYVPRHVPHRYTHFASAGLRLEAARMAGVLLSALFVAHMGHPQRALEMANYTPREVSRLSPAGC